MPDGKLDAIREDPGEAACNYPTEAIRVLLEHIAQLEREVRAKGEMLLSLDRRIEELEAAAQAVVEDARKLGWLDDEQAGDFGYAVRALAAVLEEPTSPLSREA